MTEKQKYDDLKLKMSEADNDNERVNILCEEIIKIFESQMPPLTANYWKRVKELVQ
jgi:hypothetical protein